MHKRLVGTWCTRNRYLCLFLTWSAIVVAMVTITIALRSGIAYTTQRYLSLQFLNLSKQLGLTSVKGVSQSKFECSFTLKSLHLKLFYDATKFMLELAHCTRQVNRHRALFNWAG